MGKSVIKINQRVKMSNCEQLWQEYENSVLSADRIAAGKSLIIALNRKNEYDRSLEISEQILSLARSENDIYNLYDVNQLIGITLGIKMQFKEAREAFLESIRHIDLENEALFLGAYINLANVETYLYNFKGALDYYFKAANLAVSINKMESLAFTYNNIGNVFLEIRSYNEALFYFKKSLRLKLLYLPHKNLVSNYNNIGNAYKNLKDFKRALYYFKKSEKIAMKEDIKVDLIRIYNNIASIYKNTEQTDQALVLFLKVKEMPELLNFAELKHQNDLNLAQSYLKMNLLDDAESYFYAFEKDFERFECKQLKLSFLKSYAEFCEKKALLLKSVELYEKYIALSKEFFSAEFNREMQNLQSDYDFQIKDKEIENYKKKNEDLLSNYRKIDQQRKKLKISAKSKDEIINIVSHDLKNSLGNINTIIELFNLENPSENIKVLLNLLEFTNNKGLELVREILDSNKINSEAFTIETELLDLRLHLKSLEKNICSYGETKKIAFVFKYPDSELMVQLNKSKFWQIIQNLITNAVKFSYENSRVKLKLELVRKKKRRYTCLSIQDEGLGIPKDKMPYIFHKFSKARRLGTNGEETIGLGLSIVKKLVELHAGMITVKSVENKGAIFSILLPLVSDSHRIEVRK